VKAVEVKAVEVKAVDRMSATNPATSERNSATW
jgi:hypothetical protein